MVDLLKEQKSWFGKPQKTSNDSDIEESQSFSDTQKLDKEKPTNDKQKPENTIASIYDQPIQKVDVDRYKDQSGLSMGKLKLGLLFVENRKSLITLGYGALIIIGILTWSNFFYHFGSYFIIGMRQDDKLISELINTGVAGHDLTLNNSARELEYGAVEVLSLGNSKYDIFTKVSNPNSRHWAEIEYFFMIGDNEYARTSTFVLPEETKHLSALGVEPGFGMQNNLKLVIADTKWSKIDRHIIPDWRSFRDEHLNISVTDIEFIPSKSADLSEKINLSELKFKITNNTVYNYYEVDLLILLYNRSRVIGIDKYVMDSLQSEESRNVRMTWTGTLGAVHNIEIIPEVNITRDDIYMKFDGGTPLLR